MPTISVSGAFLVNEQFHLFKFAQNCKDRRFPGWPVAAGHVPFGTLLRVDSAYRPRRTCMSVPASSERFLAKARELAADEVMLDLEDSVAPAVKDTARDLAVGALKAGGWDGRLVAVRINGASTPWAYKDVIAVVEGAPGAVDSLVLPKVTSPSAVSWLDVLLGQAEQVAGLPTGAIGIEAQIEDAAGLAAVEAIAAASPRLVSLVFGPADFMASIGMRSLTVGGQPAGYDFDAHHYPLMRMLVAARANGLQAIDGPYARIQDTEGLRKASASVAALGYDGKWVLHPAQVPVVNEAFTPAAEEYWRALAILAAYDRATSLDRRGAVMLGDEMIDEASRKMALMLAAKGAAAGLPGPPRPPEPPRPRRSQRPELRDSPRPERVEQAVGQRQRVQFGRPRPHGVVRVVAGNERAAGDGRRVVPDVEHAAVAAAGRRTLPISRPGATTRPVSSRTSRTSAAASDSPASTRPPGIDHSPLPGS